MFSVEQANEIVVMLRELEMEQKLTKDMFNRALRRSQSGREVKLNFRQAERHMPGVFNGKATGDTEYILELEARPQNTMRAITKFERFRPFLELLSRFEFVFCRRANYFKKNSICVCSGFNHTQCDCTCTCVVACFHTCVDQIQTHSGEKRD